MTDNGDQQLTRAEAAALAGIQPNTWSAYVTRGQAPKPVAHIARTPLWSRADVEHWAANRPGPGRPPKPGTAERPTASEDY